MKIIGITGPSGAGKSTFCNLLKKHGLHCVDADTVYHSMLSCGTECTDAVTKRFGVGVLSSDGSVDRKKLAEIVFKDKSELEALNSLVLGFVIGQIKKILSELDDGSKNFIAAVDAPTLIESGFNRECNLVVSVLAPADILIKRIVVRDGISTDAARLRIESQKTDEFYKANSDYVIYNNGDPSQFRADIEKLLKEIGVC